MLALEYDGPSTARSPARTATPSVGARLGDLGWDVVVVTSAMILDPVASDDLAARVLRKLG